MSTKFYTDLLVWTRGKVWAINWKYNYSLIHCHNGEWVGLSDGGTGRGLWEALGFVTSLGSEDPSKSFRLKALRTTGRIKRHKDRTSGGSRVAAWSWGCWFLDIPNKGTFSISPPFFQSDGIVPFQSNIWESDPRSFFLGDHKAPAAGLSSRESILEIVWRCELYFSFTIQAVCEIAALKQITSKTKIQHFSIYQIVDSNFRAFWLAHVTWNILGYSLFCRTERKMARRFAKVSEEEIEEAFFLSI